MLLKLFCVLKGEAQVVDDVDFRRRAGGVDGAQDVESNAPAFRFAEFGGGEHALFNAQSALAAIVGVLELGMLEIERQFVEVVDHVVGGAIDFRRGRPDRGRTA